MEGLERAQLVVKNTFIDAVEDDEEEDGGPGRTVSDQTGLRVKRVQPLGRLSGRAPPPINEEGASVITEQVAEGLFCDNEDEDEDDDDDDGVLTRTQSVAYPAYSLSAGLGLGLGGLSGEDGAKGSAEDPHSLNSPENAAGGLEAFMGDPNFGMNPWGFSPYMYNGGYGMFPPFPMPGMPGMMPFSPAVGSGQGAGEEGDEASGEAGSCSSAAWPTLETPALGEGPPLGVLHAFHPETREMGIVTPDFRTFSKVGYVGRLSVISEKEVHTDGVQRYLVQFSSGELSRADGVGFVFSPRLPCAKNIQRIVSIFVNQRGRICMRIFADIVRASAYVKPLELGDWVEMAIDLESRVATFNIWPRTETGWPVLSGRPASTAVFPYGEKLGRLNQANHKAVKLNVGHLACVVKNVNVTITLAS